MITYIKSLKRTGNLTYEYNPLHNYQTNVDLYQTTTNVGPVIFPKGCAVNSDTGEILYKYITSNNNGTSTTIWYDKNNNQVTNVVSSGNIYATAGVLGHKSVETTRKSYAKTSEKAKEAQKEAVKELWLSEHSTSFPYLRYYEALSIVRGARIHAEHATCFGISPHAKRQVLDLL